MVYNIRKILYTLCLAVIFAIPLQEAKAGEVVTAKEISSEMKAENSESFVRNTENYLGDEFDDEKIIKNKPEFYIKNIGDYIKDKKKEKQTNSIPQEEEQHPDIIINCKEMEYFEDRSELEARNDVEIVTPNGSKATADYAIYNRDNNTIKLINNVTLNNGTANIKGDYMLIDLNEENAIMDEPSTTLSTIVINAEEGFAYSDRIENLNGNIEFNEKTEIELATSGFTRYGRAINPKRLVDFSLKKKRSKPYSFKTKEIVIHPLKDHDSMVLKNVDVYYNKHKILNIPYFEIFSDKEMTYTEANFPLDFGSIKGFGMYLGLGYTFKLPKASSLRVQPAVTYGDSRIGFGGMAMYKSKRFRLESGWTSSTKNLIVDGNLKVTDRINFDFGRHVYKSEWFNGGTRAGYIGELSYKDSFFVKELADSIFTHRASIGYVIDYKRHEQEKHSRGGMRYRYQAQLRKDFKTIGSREQDMFLRLSGVAQTMATVYQDTGDTTALIRVGPSIETKVKRWNSIITYMVGGKHGESPYHFDEYRYGRQSVSFDESLILNRFISVGYRGTLTPLKDNRDRDLITENRFYAVVGPEDIKIAFAYDTIRGNMNFDFLFLLGSDNLNVRYDKLIIKDPQKLKHHQKKESDRELYRVKVPESI